MSPELDSSLCKKYPKIFVNRNGDPRTTAMCWGFECEDGWYHLIDVLCEALQNTYSTGFVVHDEVENNYIRLDPPQIVADQVKEKYGSLRFYFHQEYTPNTQIIIQKWPEKAQEILNGYRSYFNGIVHMAETMSIHTCEVTGSIGSLHSYNGWIKVLNPEYAQKNASDYTPIQEEIDSTDA